MKRAEANVPAARLLEWDALADELDDVDALFYEIEITRHHHNVSGRTLRSFEAPAAHANHRRLVTQQHRLTGRQYPHLCLGRDAGRFACEVMWRIAERVRPESRDGERIERAPVDRDRDARPDPQDRFSRALWIEVAGPESRPPTPNRQQGDLDGPRETVHLGAQVRVAREVHARAPRDPVSQRLRGRAERTSSPIVFGAYRLDHDAADAESLAGLDLLDFMAGPAHDLSESLRHDDAWPAAKAPKGREVQVIVMRVGDEDDVDIGVVDEMGHGLGVAVEQAQPIHEQRVGENAHAIHLDEDGRVSEVTKTRSHRPSLMRE